MAKEHDIDISGHKATNIRDSKIQEMDIILCATENHKQIVLYLYPMLKGKVYTIKEYADEGTKDLNISDPWGYDIEVYRKCFNELYDNIKKINDKIK